MNKYFYRNWHLSLIFGLLSTLLIYSSIYGVQADTDYGPESVWSPDSESQMKILQCISMGKKNCLLDIMKTSGASPAAINVADILDGEGYLSSFEEKGAVDLAIITYPYRANDNFQPVLINGKPQLIFVEEFGEIDITNDVLYPSLIGRYPQMMKWPGDSRYVGIENPHTGKISYYFAYNLVNGCHACEIVGTVLVAFDFKKNAKFIGTRLVGLSEGSELPVIPTQPPAPVPIPPNVNPRSVPQNGEWLAYLDKQENVWIVSWITGDKKQITNDAALLTDTSGDMIGAIDYGQPRWSSDGKRLAYLRSESDYSAGKTTTSLILHDFASGESRTLVEPIDPTYFTWSPDGASIVYSPPVYLPQFDYTNEGGEINGLWQIDIVSGVTSELVAPEHGYPLTAPIWTPDGKKISFDEIVYIEGRGYFGYYDFEKNLYTAWDQEQDERIGSYSWLPDGEHLIYDGNIYVVGPGNRLWQADIQHSEIISLTPQDANRSFYNPQVSPDGTLLLFSGSDFSSEPPRYSLWVSDTAGNYPISIAEDKYEIWEHDWSPDGSWLHYISCTPDGCENYQINLYEMSSSDTIMLANGRDAHWQPAGLSDAYEISGQILDYYTHNPLPGVEVIDNTGHQTLTDENGNFVISGLSDGVYTITPFLDGYIFIPRDKKVTLSPDSRDIIFIGSGDLDGDALYDVWEVEGYDADGDGEIDLDLPAMGADPNHKDIFVEVDYMEDVKCFADHCITLHSHKLREKPVAIVVESFKNAPVSNIDGTNGINLHVDLGLDRPMSNESTWGGFSRSNVIPHIELLDWQEFYKLKAGNFESEREEIFHYVISAHHYYDPSSESECISGSGSLVGFDIIIALGGWGRLPQEGDHHCTAPARQFFTGTDWQQAGTFMHELGHNLGLNHGGGDEINAKPNYLSIMNYAFQMTGVVYLGQVGGKFDYSRSDKLQDLVEFQLDEHTGLNGGSSYDSYGTVWTCPDGSNGITLAANDPIDWNCNGRQDEASVSVNLNKGFDEKSPEDEIMRPFFDWERLTFSSEEEKVSGSDKFDQRLTDEMTLEQYLQLSIPYELSLSGPAGITALPGYTKEFEISIGNVGENPDRILIIVTTRKGWADLTLFPNSINLDPNQEKKFPLQIRIPKEAALGEQDVIQIIVSSVGNPLFSTSHEIIIEAAANTEVFLNDLPTPEGRGTLKSLVDSLRNNMDISSFALFTKP